ncbi:methyltransferase [Nocardia huaxiensis]|uniref:Methyltransferase n=1 Tax=Nocardia huaxiensis TaxID=2755382 RepID=A0A7D6V8H6_9NOCA|nr:methyltransferase [Nocardia huaxiensis]QLY28911.1 methyltransferase [Nocardia huaxiensis]UFS97614.1 hydroxyneurosporene methyltransferase [Nocardia huaxiensis]
MGDDPALVQSLRDMAWLATPMALRVAATLRLADHIPEFGATATELATSTATSAPALTRVLAHLVTLGVLTARDDTYHLTELGRQLRSDADNELLLELDINSAVGRAELAYVELEHAVRTGEAAYPRRYGRDFWSDLAEAPALRESFDAKMTRRIRAIAPQIARRYDWSRFTTVVDVGGGQGTVLSAILRQHPSVRGQLVDLPATATRAVEEFAASGLADRATVVAGSFFDPLPAGADAYLLSDILHDWDDAHARRILSRCAEAAGRTGTILIVEAIHGRGSHTAIDLTMLVFFGGRERTLDEFATLVGACGLYLKSVSEIAENRTLLEVSGEPNTP